MTSQPISRRSPISQELTTEIVDGQPDRYDTNHQSGSSRARSSVGPRPSPAPTTARLSNERRPGGRMRPAMTHFQGDFASGQRSRLVPVVVLGTFASRGAADTSSYH
jgi:hypothetical protein